MKIPQGASEKGSFPVGFFCVESLPRHAGPDSDMAGSGTA